MKSFLSIFCCFINTIFLLSSCQSTKTPVLETGTKKTMPSKWIDKDTGHLIKKVIPGEGENRSFYFHNNPFLPAANGNNEKMIFYRKVNHWKQLFSVDLKTSEIDQITNKERVSGEIVAPNSREVFYQCGDSVFATGIENHQTRLIYVFPDTMRGHITTLNADGTLLAGALNSPKERELFKDNPKKKDYFNLIYEAKLRRTLFTISVETGKLDTIYSENAWLNHIQFSPTDPEILMFCHEGPWHKVNRIWTINIKKDTPKLIHKRTMNMEIAGHEFFSPDGKTIWFDLQRPRGKDFSLAGTNLSTGKEKIYKHTRNEWSVHYTISPDQTIFAGDGGARKSVANAPDGKWIYLFTPDGDKFKSEKLVNMINHNYGLEPNVHFSPDQKWIIFRANFEGHSDIYAVKIEKQ